MLAARGGTLVVGGGFGGAHVARLLGDATIVSPESSMLFTPLLPEVAAGALEPRHAYVPLRMMCPDAEQLRGRVTALDRAARTVSVLTELGEVEVSYRRLVIALGSVARMLPIPGLSEHAMTFKDLGDAVRLRNHVLRQLDLAEADPRHASRHLVFVFVGAGYAGVEALAELRQLVEDAVHHYPALRDVRQRWVLVDAGPGILGEVPRPLAEHDDRPAAPARCRDPDVVDRRVGRCPRRDLGRRQADRHRDPRVDGRRRRQPGRQLPGPAARPEWPDRRRLLAAGARAPGHLGPR